MSSVNKSRTAGTLLAVLIFLQAISAGAGWPQEHAPPRIDEEFTKQETIYRGRGADGTRGYITSRGLSDYVALLPSGFCNTLAKLGSADRWLDIGAGAGLAILDYYNLTKCARRGVKARAVAMSIEDRRTDDWKKQAASLGERIRYVSGKALRHYSLEELGKFQMITDVYGGFSYTEDLSRFMERVLSLLETNGVFYTMLQGVRLEDGKDQHDTAYQTELLDPVSSNVKVCSWLKKISCVKVGCESSSEWAPTERINIRKVCSDVSVPRLKLLEYQSGAPPGRRFQLEP
jgi:SAM-dependent methyltransferase